MNRRAMASRWALLAAVILVTTVGCAGPPDSGAGTQLMWAVGGIDSADRGPAVDIAKRWNDRHPNGPTVVVEALPEDQAQLLALELNAGLSEFDIFDLDVIWTPEFAENGWLVDLEELRPEIERVSLPGPVQTAIWDGKLWAAPYTTNAGILYYRKDLVSEPPKTWEELEKIGRAVGQQQGIAPFVADGAPNEGLVVQYLEYLWGAGGEVLNEDGQSVLSPPDRAEKAADFMRQAFNTSLYAPGFNTMRLEDARRTFQDGQAVFMRSWPYAYRQMNKTDPASQVIGKVGIAPLPTFAGAGPVTALGGHNLAVSKFSDNVATAREFVEFVSTSEEVQRELAERHSMPPTMKTVYDDLADDPMMALLARVLPTARPRPATPEWNTISEEMQQQIFAAYTGDSETGPEIDGLREFLRATVQGR